MKNAVKIIIGLLLGIIVTYAFVIINNKAYSYYSNEETNTIVSKTFCPYNKSKCEYETLPDEVAPVIGNGLVPVKILDDGTVKKVSTDNSNLEWYDYTGKVWANAVVLKNKKAKDLSGNNNDATIHGATLTSDGLYFDGVDDYAVTDSVLNYNSASAITIEFKAKIIENGSASIMFESSQNTNQYTNGYFLEANELSLNDITYCTTYNSGYNVRYATNVINESAFETYTVTINSTDANKTYLSVYKNGVKQVVTPSDKFNKNLTGFAFNNYNFYIGSRAGTGLFTNMTLKDLKIYTKELTQQEINNNLNGNTTTSNLLLHYNFDYADGDTIPESDIESYFVWIPKFRYKLWNVGVTNPIANAHEIDIIFGDYNTTDKTGECATPMISGSTGNCQNGDYMTHPAFLSMNTKGFWVGKFETGYNGATTTSEAQVNESDATKVIIKPNVYSWTKVTVGNAFAASYNYLRDLDSHMMKNTEWGAVAYLSHSKYGIDTEVNINNSSDLITGRSALTSTNQAVFPGSYGSGNTYSSPYNTSNGVLASTTGNISGVYDMSGGVWEYVTAYVSSQAGSSGLTLENCDPDYFDVYNASSNESTYNYRILGDATGEMGPIFEYNDADSTSRKHNSWYGDYAYFINSSSSWLARGGVFNDGVDAGQFTFDKFSGGVSGWLGYRITLAPTN